MSKKIFSILLLSLLLTTYNTIGQINFLTGEQTFIKKATTDVLYIVRQDYILRDTTSVNPNEYGLGGHDYFGRVYRLAVLSENKLWCENSIKTPWKFDSNFEEYKNNGAIRPVLGKIAVRKINESHYSYIDISGIQTTNYDTLLSKLSVSIFGFSDNLPGIENIKEKKDGNTWIVLASTKEDIQTNDSCAIKLTIYKFPVRFSEDKLDAPVKNPTITKNLLGGILFNEQITTGKIELLFTGVLNQRQTNWYISTLPENKTSATDNSLHIILNESDYAKIQFVYEDGFALKNLCKIKAGSSDKEYCTDENGFVKIPVTESTLLITLNGKGAICAKKGETLKVICKYSGGVFIPKKIVKECH